MAANTKDIIIAHSINKNYKTSLTTWLSHLLTNTMAKGWHDSNGNGHQKKKKAVDKCTNEEYYESHEERTDGDE